MSDRPRLRLTWLAGAMLVACIPLLLPVLALHDPRLLMFPYVAVLDTLAALACLRMAWGRSSLLRPQWSLFTAHFVMRGISLWVPALRVWTGWPGPVPTSWIVSWSSALATMFCLLAFTVVGRQVRPLKRTVDVGLTAILCGLHFLSVFSTHTAGFTSHYLQMSFAVALFLLLVARAAYLSATTTGEQGFTHIALIYLLARVVLLFSNSIVNYTWLSSPRELPFDLLFGAPQLCFLLLVFSYKPSMQAQRPLPTPKLLVQNLLPSMILLGSMGLALNVFSEHVYLAGTAMLLAVALFIVRTHLLYQRLLLEQQQLLARAGYLEKLASRDALTGIGNRRWLEEMASALLVANAPAALLLVDTDEFKSINDDFGHHVGDELLKMIAEVLLKQSEVVEDCVCVRLGGDEFVVLLPTTVTEQARQVAERVRLQVESATAQHGPRTSTVSVGIAAGSAQPKLSALLQLADEALYRAKSKGRNLVQASDEDATYFHLEQSRINSRRFRREHAPAQVTPD